MKQRLKTTTFAIWGAIEKRQILLSQYWKNILKRLNIIPGANLWANSRCSHPQISRIDK